MSYGGTENTISDIDVLEGAVIEKAWLGEWDDGFEQVGEGVVRLRVRFRKGLTVNGKTHGEYEVWVDPEGNGPGFLSFVMEG